MDDARKRFEDAMKKPFNKVQRPVLIATSELSPDVPGLFNAI
jgi:hypothetical protein